jgi:hypothetical protein
MFDWSPLHVPNRSNGMIICEGSRMQRYERVSMLCDTYTACFIFFIYVSFHRNATNLVSHAFLYGTPRALMAGHRYAPVWRRASYTRDILSRVSARPRPMTLPCKRVQRAGRNISSQTVFRNGSADVLISSSKFATPVLLLQLTNLVPSEPNTQNWILREMRFVWINNYFYEWQPIVFYIYQLNENTFKHDCTTACCVWQCFRSIEPNFLKFSLVNKNRTLWL